MAGSERSFPTLFKFIQTGIILLIIIVVVKTVLQGKTMIQANFHLGDIFNNLSARKYKTG